VFPGRGRKADVELLDLHAEPLGRQEVAELVDADQKGEAEDGDEEGPLAEDQRRADAEGEDQRPGAETGLVGGRWNLFELRRHRRLSLSVCVVGAGGALRVRGARPSRGRCARARRGVCARMSYCSPSVCARTA